MSNSKDNKSMYEQQEDRIRIQSDAFISLLTQRGILGDHQIDDEKIRSARQEKQRNTYHNTLMLLKNYRIIAWMRDIKEASWKDVIASVLEECNSEVPLSYLYEQIADNEKTKSNKWWKEKIRQTLQCNPAHFLHTGRGMWKLNRNAA